MIDKNILRKIKLFESINDLELEALSKHFVFRKFPKNSVIINEGDTASSMYIILDGRVKVYLNDEHGKEVTLNIQEPGDYFGEVSLFDDGKRSASIMTLEKCQFALLEKQEFIKCMGSNPQLALTIIKGLTFRLRVLSENVRNLALLDVYGRVTRTLIELATERDGKQVITEKLTQIDLASRVGASPKMVSRILKDLKTGGYISKHGQHLVINKSLPPAW